MPGVIYPSNIKTDRQKLNAVYSLIEQARLEYNKNGQIARDAGPSYDGKWNLYTKWFRQKRRELLKEQEIIRRTILFSQVPDFTNIPEEQRFQAEALAFGDKRVYAGLPTKATSELLDRIKLVSVHDFDGIVIDPIENFTGSTWNNGTPQADPNSRLTITASKILAGNTGVGRDETVYFYRSYAIGLNDWEHDFELYNEGDDSCYCGVLTIADYVGDINATGNVIGMCALNGTSDPRFYIVTWVDGASQGSDGGSFSASTNYYCTWYRDNTATDVTCDFYSDSGRSTLVDTLYRSSAYCEVDGDYLYGIQSRNTGSSADWLGYMQNLDLKEAASFQPAWARGCNQIIGA